MGPRVRTLENTEPRPRDMMRTRTHPFLASHNPWTWKFVPGMVVGFLAHLWLSHNQQSKVNALVQASLQLWTLGLCLTLLLLQGSTSDTESQDDEGRWHGNVEVPEEELKVVRHHVFVCRDSASGLKN